MTDDDRAATRSYLLTFRGGAIIVELSGPAESVKALVRTVVEPGKDHDVVRDELETRAPEYGVDVDVWVDIA